MINSRNSPGLGCQTDWCSRVSLSGVGTCESAFRRSQITDCQHTLSRCFCGRLKGRRYRGPQQRRGSATSRGNAGAGCSAAASALRACSQTDCLPRRSCPNGAIPGGQLSVMHLSCPDLSRRGKESVIRDAVTYTEHAAARPSPPWTSSTPSSARAAPSTASVAKRLLWTAADAPTPPCLRARHTSGFNSKPPFPPTCVPHVRYPRAMPLSAQLLRRCRCLHTNACQTWSAPTRLSTPHYPRHSPRCPRHTLH